jgi:hypothetical protein
MIYVGSAESAEYDQVLDSIMVGPIPVGINKFVFSVRPLFRSIPYHVHSYWYHLMKTTGRRTQSWDAPTTRPFGSYCSVALLFLHGM